MPGPRAAATTTLAESSMETQVRLRDLSRSTVPLWSAAMATGSWEARLRALVIRESVLADLMDELPNQWTEAELREAYGR